MRSSPSVGPGLDVDAALELLALPPAGPRVRSVEGQRRARLAANARVSGIVERQQRNAVRPGVVPHLPGGPVSERAGLGQRLPGWQLETFDFFQRRARRRLLAPQS